MPALTLEDALEKATSIGRTAHAGQKDKLGSPFLSHLERVAGRVSDPRQKIVAFLHDVLEKGRGWDMGKLQAAGFDGDILEAVGAMTRRPAEPYHAFVERAAAHPLARNVKIADLADNLEQMDLKGSDGGKYREALARLGAY